MKKTLLLITDLEYRAKGREYFREDIELSNLLRKQFKVCISHINDMDPILDSVDSILVRNTGLISLHQQQLAALRQRSDLHLSNDLRGKGDVNGKGHLLELFQSGYPVIPTFASKEAIQKFRSFDQYLLKPLNGADSIGVKILNAAQFNDETCDGSFIIQPLVDFAHEVSFYFIDGEFHYALYAPNRDKRWDLVPFLASDEDLAFASKFIEWNTCQRGIQRIDACRLPSGELLLMELEDYNPYLSLELLEPKVKERFIQSLCRSIVS